MAARAGSHSTTDGSTNAVEIGHVGMACWLWFKQHEILSATWANGFCRWTFASSPELHADMEAFRQGRATVDARDYFHRVSEFKQKMYRDKPQ